MRVIYKYPIPIQDVVKNDIPVGGEILKFAMQKGQAFIWVLIDPDQKETETRHFLVIGTGHKITDTEHCDGKYIDTVFINDGSLVFHLFELSAERLKDVEGGA